MLPKYPEINMHVLTFLENRPLKYLWTLTIFIHIFIRIWRYSEQSEAYKIVGFVNYGSD